MVDHRRQEAHMPEQFKVGDRVGWNSEAGHVSGTIIRVHTRDFDYKGHAHRATPTAIRDQEQQNRPYCRPQGLGADQAERLTDSTGRDQTGAVPLMRQPQPRSSRASRMSRSPRKLFPDPDLPHTVGGDTDDLLLLTTLFERCVSHSDLVHNA